VKTFNSDRLCQNATFWKDRGNKKRCNGNNPGQINPGTLRHTELGTESVEPCLGSFGRNCKDNSEVVCKEYTKACTSNLTKLCDNDEFCIHHTLECDGYIHCRDVSDEDESKCRLCPRDFGYPADKLKVDLTLPSLTFFQFFNKDVIGEGIHKTPWFFMFIQI
jgi:hypothetical protein